DEMDDLEIIYPYEIEEDELPPLLANSDTSSDFEPEAKAKDEDEDEATVGTITQASYSIPPFSGTAYVGTGSSHKMRGLMLEDKKERKRLQKKLRASQQEKEQMEQAFH
nr:hypothetical protein [Tanacetum cinerariifolium]